MFGIRPTFPLPAPAPGPANGDKPPAPAQSHRVRYVVLGVMTERTSETEMLHTIRLRRADQRGEHAPVYLYRVAQKPGTPAPAAINAILDIDSRLVDREQGT